jgi:hypothetical protein
MGLVSKQIQAVMGHHTGEGTSLEERRFETCKQLLRNSGLIWGAETDYFPAITPLGRTFLE